MPDKFLTAEDARKFISVSRSRLYQLVATDKSFPAHKIGDKLLFDQMELCNWIKAHDSRGNVKDVKEE